jgi:hypothetical protein
MSDNDKPSSSGTTVVSNDPWEGQRPYLKRGFAQADTQLSNPRQAYPNSTVVPLHGATTDALGKIRDRATAGSPLQRQGKETIGAAARGDFLDNTPRAGLLQETASGNFLGSNPHLQDLIDQAIESTRASTDAQFTTSGRYGSGLHQGVAEDRAGHIATGILAPAYESERGRMVGAQGQLAGLGQAERATQMNAASLAPDIAASDYSDFERLGSVGGAFEAQGQAELADRIQRHDFNQQAPRDALREFMANVGGGSYGSSSSTTRPIYSDPFAKYLGYGASGAGIAGSLFGKDGVFA